MLLWTICLWLVILVSGQTVLSQVLDFRYHNYKNMESFLRNFTNDHPDMTTLSSIGHSVEGRDLLVVEVTAKKGLPVPNGIPNVKLIGNIHGNEAVGREILLHFLEFLVTNYDKDPTVRWLLDTTRIHILPSLNPDGFEIASEGLCAKGLGRENANSEDLNRSFPDFFKDNAREPQPEALAMQSWMARVPFVLSASLHGGALVANYPFENLREDLSLAHYPPSISPDDDVFRFLANVYASKHPSMHKGEACDLGPSFRDGITNGAAWYPITGGMQDYNYIAHGCMEITMEISCCKYPSSKTLPRFWDENKSALLSYVSQVHRGVRGQVVDGTSPVLDRPLANATLRILGRDISFYTSNVGEFWRILLPGNYQLQIEMQGYRSRILNFTVVDYRDSFPVLTTLYIRMYPTGMDPTTVELSSAPIPDLPTGAIQQVSSESARQMAKLVTTPRAPSEFNDNLSINIHINQLISLSDPMETLSVGPAAAVTAGATQRNIIPLAVNLIVHIIISLYMFG